MRKKYDAHLHWAITQQCNLDCDYCISKDRREEVIKTFKDIQEINISALIKILDDTKKTFRISFTGGEVFLIPNIVEACIAISQNHFISIVTNLTSDKVKDFAEKVDPNQVIRIHASTHIKELERLNLLDKYINNFLLCKEKGFPINASEVAHPQLLNEVENYRNFFQEMGIRLKFQKYIGEYNGKIYPKSYTKKEIKAFDLNKTRFNVNSQKGRICNAGYNISWVDMNGNMKHCNYLNKNDGNIYEKIQFNNTLMRCPIAFCECPLNTLDPFLFVKAIKEINLTVDSHFLKKNITPFLANFLKKRKIKSYIHQ